MPLERGAIAQLAGVVATPAFDAAVRRQAAGMITTHSHGDKTINRTEPSNTRSNGGGVWRRGANNERQHYAQHEETDTSRRK
jgi:hypothetical protein